MVSISTGKDSEQDVQTPVEFLDAVQRKFGEITFDLSASDDNAVVNSYSTIKEDSLSQDWLALQKWLPSPGILWLNPPYSDITPWVKKCSQTHLFNWNKIALLVAASVGANWWRDYVHQDAVVYFLNGRIKFVGHTHPFPKDLALCLYGCDRFDTDPWYYCWDWKNG